MMLRRIKLPLLVACTVFALIMPVVAQEEQNQTANDETKTEEELPSEQSFGFGVDSIQMKGGEVDKNSFFPGTTSLEISHSFGF